MVQVKLLVTCKLVNVILYVTLLLLVLNSIISSNIYHFNFIFGKYVINVTIFELD
jgi:hypothetical protein